MAGLDFKQVSFSYRDAKQDFGVLNNLELQISPGEFVCVLGPSGSGKSTLLSLTAGLLTPDSGQILLDGQPLPGPGVDRAVVFQQYSLFPWLSARENVAFGLRQARKGLGKRQARQLAEEYLQQVGMAEAMDKYPHQLSGGMQQRVASARALALDARMLLLDEPFGALDAKRRQELQQLLLRLWQERTERPTILFVTHDISEAVLLADRIVFLAAGKILADLPCALPRPRQALAAQLDEEYLALCRKLHALFDRAERDEEGQP